MSLIIAGDRSGVGKTTVTLALLSYLSRKHNFRVQSFKVGPDYIDPMFHGAVTNRPCRNLDPVLTSPEYIRSCFDRHCQGTDYALIEGVMGLFDGIQQPQSLQPEIQPNCSFPVNDFASTAHIARLLDLPVLLILDCSRLSGSIAAIAHGYNSFDRRVKIAGLVLNRVASDRHLELLQDALEPLHLAILGVLKRQQSITIPDRHLGLVPSAELKELTTIFDRLAELATHSFNWQHLLPLLESKSRTSSFQQPTSIKNKQKPIQIAVARDLAFNFYYQDNLDILTELGAQLIFWSPLEENLTEEIQGMYFGGGFPEVFAQQLSENKLARDRVKNAIRSGMPTIAECGGLMYLCEQIIDFEGKSWQMTGILPTNATMNSQLTLGYRQATALQDTPLLSNQQIVWGHEFHRSQLTSQPRSPLYQTQTYKPQSPLCYEGWQSFQLHASYIHLHFGANESIAKKFLRTCTAQNNELYCNK